MNKANQTGPGDFVISGESVVSPAGNLEIERKFLVEHPRGDVEAGEGHQLKQGYLALTDTTEVRLRQMDTAYYLAVKLGQGFVRSEREIQLSGEQFEELWPATKGKRIEKCRYLFAEGGCELVYDVYGGGLAGLRTVEIEFSSEEAGLEYAPLEWFGHEVTGDRRYQNGQLAVNGVPAG